MFHNVGSKIKMLAKIELVLCSVFFILLGFGIICGGGISGIILDDILSEAKLRSAEMSGLRFLVNFFVGFLTILFGSLFSLIQSCLLYGFGELIEKVSDIAYYTREEKYGGSFGLHDYPNEYKKNYDSNKK